MQEFYSSSAAATRQIAREFSRLLRPGDIVFLQGTLGVGKTQFAGGVVAGLGGDDLQVSSPTYGLVHEYQTSYCRVFHSDLYRLNRPAEVLALGLDECRQNGVLLIEWPDKGQPYLGDADKSIQIDLFGATRQIRLIGVN